MEQSVTQLFALIRSGLWKEQPNFNLFGNDTNWNEVFQLAQKQTVLGFVIDGLSMLPIALQPNKGMQIKAHSLQIRTTQHHHLLNDVISELSSRLKKEGIHSVLLKGQGLAQNYPDPFKRACGDIDLYVGNHNYKKTCQLLKQWGMLKGEAEESSHHFHFFYREVPIEIHRIAGILYGLFRNKRFRKWSDTLLQGEECRSCSLGGEAVYLPPIRFDAMFIFYHMYRHLITGGVGLRQLCDCVMYLHRFKDEINRNLLHEDLCRMGLMRIWKIFGCIAVHHLGLPKEEFPFYSDTAEIKELSEFLLEEVILRNGNFGHYNPDKQARPKGYLAGKLFSLRNTLLYLRKMQRIFGSETLNFLLFYIYKGISNILHDTIYGKKKK
jgi:hypothetical protein